MAQLQSILASFVPTSYFSAISMEKIIHVAFNPNGHSMWKTLPKPQEGGGNSTPSPHLTL